MLVETFALSKRYRDLTALEDCTFGVQRGEVFGLLGPNGAGKTTLLRLLLGYLRPSAGRALVDGLDVYRHAVRVHRIVSYLPGEVRLFRNLRGREVLRFFAEVRGNSSPERSFGLADRLELDVSRRVAFMSTGMRQKLALVATLAAGTPLLILDEPTSNLDPNMRATVMELVRAAKQDGRTVMFSSHVLSEVEEVCDRVAILRGGRMVHTQVMSELNRRHRIHVSLLGSLPVPPAALRDRLSIASDDGQHVVIDTLGELPPLLGWLATLPVREMRIEPIGLRAVYDRFHTLKNE